MSDHMIQPEEIGRLTREVALYVAEERERYRPSASPLATDQSAAMASYFPPDLLGTVRVAKIDRGVIEKPTFFLIGLDLVDRTALDAMAAITFDDTIVAQVPITDDILFHELVHAEQYKQLGIEGFASAYARGYLDGGGYIGVPLEVHAYELTARFAGNPGEPFWVPREVQRWIEEGCY